MKSLSVDLRSDAIFSSLQVIGDTSGKDAKQAAVKRLMQLSPHALKCMIACYDPMITYGIKIPAKQVGTGIHTFTLESPSIWGETNESLLNQLATRSWTGNVAKSHVAELAAALTPDSFELLKNIINGSLKAGFTAGTMNRAIPNTIEIFSCMLAQKYLKRHEAGKVTYPVIADTKSDGMRCLIICKDGVGKPVTREGRDIPAVQHIADQIAKAVKRDEWLEGDYVIDGEIVDGQDKNNFDSTVGHAKRKSVKFEHGVLMAFDLIPLDEFEDGKSSMGCYNRMSSLDVFVDIADLDCLDTTRNQLAHSHEEVMAIYADNQSRGYEGCVIKDPDGKYVTKRDYGWLKLKAEHTIDLEIISVIEGTAGSKNEDKLGALVGRSRDGTITADVGGGFSDAQRIEFWYNPPIGQYMEVTCHDATAKGSLRHPVFKHLRHDITR